MSAFLYGLSVTFLAVTLLASGLGHVLHFARFSQVIRSHDMLPRAWSTVVAALVTLFELGAATAFVLMPAGILALPAGVSLATVATAGIVFFLYMRRLLRHPAGATSCGCSPLTGPLTPASLVPSAGLVVAAVLGLASLAVGADPVSPGRAGVALSMCWGATLAMLVLLLPAVAVPQQALESRP